MFLYLVQHAEAKSEKEDPERGLTEKGIEDLKKISIFLSQIGIEVKKIWHSGKKRALQTAEILKSYVVCKNGAEEIKGLSPLDDPEIIYEKIKNFDGDLMIVGHLPHLSKLSSFLILKDKDKEIIEFKMGCVLCIKKKDEKWLVDWLIKPF